MSKIITAAAETTDAVQERASRAIQNLEEAFSGRIVNGAGVYADPTTQKRALVSTISLLSDALRRMQDTTWPVGQDYDAA